MKPDGSIGVLVAAAQEAERNRLGALLRADPRFACVALAGDADSALAALGQQNAAVVLVDDRLSPQGGADLARRIMETLPRPVVLYAGPGACEAVAARAQAAGAVAGVQWPAAAVPGTHGLSADARLLQTLQLMSEVHVVRRWSPRQSARTTPALRPRVVGVGASTGGPPVLQTILAALPTDFALPLLVVQHIAAGFLPGLVDWLRQTSGPLPVVAQHGVLPLPGHAYLAPDGWQMGLGADGRLVLAASVEACGAVVYTGGARTLATPAQPSVAFLFRSLADVCGPQAIGVLLTGMGKDGAQELKQMRDRGAFTIAQDGGSSVVHGMAGAAIALGGASHVLPADRIAPALINLARSTPPAHKETLA